MNNARPVRFELLRHYTQVRVCCRACERTTAQFVQIIIQQGINEGDEICRECLRHIDTRSPLGGGMMAKLHSFYGCPVSLPRYTDWEDAEQSAMSGHDDKD